MNQTKQLNTACTCAQFCMLCMSTCVASFMLFSTMVSPTLKVCLSLYTLLRSHLRSHLFVNCCIRRYSIYTLLTMRIGFSFARYFFFTCSAEMSVSLFTGCVHPHKVMVFIAASDSGQQSHTRCRLLRCVGWCTSIRTAVSCERSYCAAVSLARLCGRPHISEFCRDFV